MKRHFRIPVAAALLLATISLSAGAEPVDETREVLPDALIELSGVSGEFRIVGADTDELVVAGTLSDRVEELKIEGDAARWRIEVEMKEGGGRWGWNRGPETRLEITVPRGADLTANVVSAELHVLGLRGPRLDARTVSGDLTIVESSPTRLMVGSVSGDIGIDGGGLESSQLESVSGDIEAAGMAGRVRVKSVSGDLDIDAIELSEFNAETVSGDLDAVLRPQARATIEVQTHSGNVELAMPAGTPVDFAAETFSGDLESRFESDEERVSEDGMTIRLGDASVRVRAQTFSGDLRLRASED